MMNYKVELVAQAMHKAEHAASFWDSEPISRKERFREFARNAIDLLDDDIGVLLLALEEAAAEQSCSPPNLHKSDGLRGGH
jgi:hypothetical protein